MTATPVARPRLAYPLVGVIAAIVGGPMMGASFVAGSSSFFTGDTSGILPLQIVFWVGTALVLVGLVLGIAGLVARRQRVLSAVTIVIALWPTVGLVILVAPHLFFWIL